MKASKYLERIDGHGPAEQRHWILSRTVQPFLMVVAVTYHTIGVIALLNVQLSLIVTGLCVPPFQFPRGSLHPHRVHTIANMESGSCSDLDGGRRKSSKQFQHHFSGLSSLMIMDARLVDTTGYHSGIT